MKLFLMATLAVTFSISAFAKESQLFGTHAFIELPQEYTYSHDLFGYVGGNSKIIITSNRTRVGVRSVQQQFESSGNMPIVSGQFGKIYLVEQITQMGKFSGYVLPIGDDSESAVISMLSLKEEEDTRNNILNILKTAKWNGNSDLNFEAALFFNVENLNGLYPTTFIGPIVSFTPNGEPLEHSKMHLNIGKFPLPYDYKGKEMQILEYLSNPGRATLTVKLQDYKAIKIDGMDGMMLSRSYEKDGKEIEGRLAVLFSKGRVITIEAESASREYDKYLNNFDKIMYSFKLKANI